MEGSNAESVFTDVFPTREQWVETESHMNCKVYLLIVSHNFAGQVLLEIVKICLV
jgi:acyl-ACP thioesterase